MAKVITEFKGCPDGQPKVRTFVPGDEVTGELAAVAVREGWAVDEAPPVETTKGRRKK